MWSDRMAFLRTGNLLKAMATPLPRTIPRGAIVQNAAFSPWRKSKLLIGWTAKKTGHDTAHRRKTPTVPIRLWSHGKGTKSQMAWDTPFNPMAAAISLGENPIPPRLTGVCRNTGFAAVYAKARTRT